MKDGDIVLFHDLVKETYDAITYMMPILQKKEDINLFHIQI